MFCGMHKTLHDNIYCLYAHANVSYMQLLRALRKAGIQLLRAARKAESEVLDVKGTIKSSIVGSVQESEIEALPNEITTLMSAVQGRTR